MKCHVCENRWKGLSRYCPKCGTPAGTDRRGWPWPLVLVVLSAAALTISIVMASSPALAWTRLSASQRADVGRMDAQLAQIDDQLQKCPEEQQQLLQQIGDEGKRSYFDAARNQELQNKLAEVVEKAQRLEAMKAELAGKRWLMMKGGK